MGDELEDLKRVLRSLVVSRTTEMDIRTLMRDYHELIGARLPIDKYGYRDVAEFLKERCNDCFVLANFGKQTIIRLIVNDKIKHIDQMVHKQKSSKKVSGRPKRRSIPETLIRPPKSVHSIAESFNESRRKEQKPPDKSYDRKKEKPSQSYEYKEPKQKNNTVQEQNGDNLEVSRAYYGDCRNTVKNNERIMKEDRNNNQETQEYSNLRNYQMRRASYQSVDSVQSNEDCKQTTSSSSSTKAKRFEKLKHEVVALLDQPEGVWSTDLLKLYREHYNQELEFSRFGYTSIVSMLCEWDDVVRLTRPHALSDWLLSDKRRDPPSMPRVPRPTIRIPSMQRLSPRTALDPSDALPGIEYDDEVFPEDCLYFCETIPDCPIDDIQLKSMIRIMLGEVYSPSHFWLLRADPAHYDAMCTVMDEMTLYYEKEGKNRTLALGAVRVGYYCSSLYDNDWHRSLIVKILDSEKVKVRHIDYGTVDIVQVKNLKPLLRKWGELPQQAIRAKLAGVRPTADGRRWPHATSSHFLNLVRDKTLFATVKEIDYEEKILEVLLIDTTGKEDVCINQELVKTGYADRKQDATISVSEHTNIPKVLANEQSDSSSQSPDDNDLEFKSLKKAIHRLQDKVDNLTESSHYSDELTDFSVDCNLEIYKDMCTRNAELRDSDSSSDISTSASVIVGPRTMKTWDAEKENNKSSFDTTVINTDIDTTDTESVLSSRLLNKIRSLKINSENNPRSPESAVVGAAASSTLNRIRQMHKKSRTYENNDYETDRDCSHIQNNIRTKQMRAPETECSYTSTRVSMLLNKMKAINRQRHNREQIDTVSNISESTLNTVSTIKANRVNSGVESQCNPNFNNHDDNSDLESAVNSGGCNIIRSPSVSSDGMESIISYASSRTLDRLRARFKANNNKKISGIGHNTNSTATNSSIVSERTDVNSTCTLKSNLLRRRLELANEAKI